MTIGGHVQDVPAASPVLHRDEVEVWWAALDQPAANLQLMQQTLAPDEQLRAERFRFARDRDRFVACRATLRALLARYLYVEPEHIQFCYGSHGKPMLAAPFHNNEIQFNVSHSQGVALYAFARKRAVGVDIEHIRPIADAEQIVERFFSLRERRVFRSLPTPEQLETFFTWWTRKEAWIKAIGDGLAYPLDHIDVSLNPDGVVGLFCSEHTSHVPAYWSLRSLAARPGYAAALAVEGSGWTLITWQSPSSAFLTVAAPIDA